MPGRHTVTFSKIVSANVRLAHRRIWLQTYTGGFTRLGVLRHVDNVVFGWTNVRRFSYYGKHENKRLFALSSLKFRLKVVSASITQLEPGRLRDFLKKRLRYSRRSNSVAASRGTLRPLRKIDATNRPPAVVPLSIRSRNACARGPPGRSRRCCRKITSGISIMRVEIYPRQVARFVIIRVSYYV